MSPQKIALVGLLLGSVFVLQVVLAEVNTDSIDLSRFKLRHVDTKSMTRQRADQRINDLATGALHMRESLFVNCNYIKCPAYAHLFKLIKQQRQQTYNSESLKIKQGTVESLALVVTYDRIFYHKIFVDNAQTVSADHFIEALNLLEADSKNEASNSDTWLDIAACLTEYMSAGKNRQSAERVQSFLREPKRASALASLKKFKSIPVDVGGEQTPDGLVPNLARKFDNGRAPNKLHFFGFPRSLFGEKEISDLPNALDEPAANVQTGHGKRMFVDLAGKFEPDDKMVPASRVYPGEAQNLDEARELIESLDDQQTAEARRQFAANPTEAAEELARLVAEASKQEAASRAAQEKADLGPLGDEAIANRAVELIVPTEDLEELFADTDNSSEDEYQDSVDSEDGEDQDGTLSSSSSFSSLGSSDDQSSSSAAETARQGLGDSEVLNGADAGSSLEGSQESEEDSELGKGEQDQELTSSSSAAGSLSASSSAAAAAAAAAAVSTVREVDEPAEAAASLALLKFVKLRLETKPPNSFTKAPTLSIKLAFNFANHWHDLNEALPSLNADKYGSFIGRATQFLEDPKSQLLADRIRLALESYSEIAILMEEITAKKHYDSIEEFKRPFERLSSLLSTMDQSFDVDDLRRFQTVWSKKYQELKTLDNFIDFGFGL